MEVAFGLQYIGNLVQGEYFVNSLHPADRLAVQLLSNDWRKNGTG
jgi:hypothetical protein